MKTLMPLYLRLEPRQYEVLRKCAFEQKTPMAALVRNLIEEKFICCKIPTNRLAENENNTGTTNT